MLIKLARIALKAVPPPVAFSLTNALAARTQRPKLDGAEREALASAERIHYGDNDRNIALAWGTGPLVIMVHGWSGCAAQMAPLAVRIANSGFRAVALDVSGHGESPGKHTHWRYFLNDIPALAQSLGEPVYAYVGHSAGALTMMAARHAGNISAARYVCICAPSHPFPPINVIQKKLAPRPAIIERYKAFIAQQFGTTWDALHTGMVYRDLGTNTLLFYDKTDRFVDHSEGDKVAGIAHGARLIKTDRYSHAKILTAPELLHEASLFLQEGRRKNSAS